MRCDSCCNLMATTERTRANGLPKALCDKCAVIWDLGAALAVTKTKAEPVDKQVQTLFEAVRYLVYNMLPQYVYGHKEQTRLIKELDAVIKLGE